MSIFASYYQQDLNVFLRNIVPQSSSTLRLVKQTIPDIEKKQYGYILLINSINFVSDVQEYINHLKKFCHPKTRIIVISFNFLWKPILDLARFLGLREKEIREPNWLSQQDILNLFTLEGFNQVRSGRRFLFPFPLGFVSGFINKFICQLPLINSLCLTTYQIFHPQPISKNYSVSLVIPARNEEGNIKGILKKVPKLGKKMEVIFVEGHSHDQTYQVIKEEIRQNKSKVRAFLIKQRGTGKADAVRLGFKKAKNEILIILDADLSTSPKDLTKFYRALKEGHGEFINGSRLVYPMEKQAMRTFNYLGNKIFSALFSFLLGQKIKDTLCGTKALFRSDYLKIAQNRKIFGYFDPFGDFDLLFGATKMNLKIIEIPVRYRERVYGVSNISRLTHGWLLLKMTIMGTKLLKFI